MTVSSRERNKMRVVEIQNEFGIENIKLTEKDNSKPGFGEVLVRMQAASLNYRDLLMVRGHYNPKQPLPLVPCSDGAGVVEEVGEGVTQFKAGDKVNTTFFANWSSGEATNEKAASTVGGPLQGTLTEFAVVPQSGLVHSPEHLSFTEAATLPCAALTAWSALMTYGQIKAGDKVLIQGTGGVALFALQFAKILGAEVLITSSSNEKLDKAKKLGADHLLNYRENPEWGKLAGKALGGGADIIIELGGAKTLPESFQACKPGGKIALIGVLSGVVNDLNILPMIMKKISIQGIFVGHREEALAMNRALSLHQLRPIIDKTFPLAETPQALEYMASAGHFGKICISIPD